MKRGVICVVLAVLSGGPLAAQTARDYVDSAGRESAAQNYAGAIADYTHALELDPASPLLYELRGMAKKAGGDLDGAIADYTRSLAIDPGNGDAYLKRGVAKKNTGDFSGAIADYARALAIDPKNEDASYDLALARQAQSASRIAFRYGFRKGQEFRCIYADSAQENQLGSGRVLAAGVKRSKELILDWQILDVDAAGSATIRVRYAHASIKMQTGNEAICLDSSQTPAESNPVLACVPEANPFLMQLDRMRRMVSNAIVGKSYQIAVSRFGQITAVEGVDDVMDGLRDEFGNHDQDPAARAQVDSALEAYYGEDSVKQTLSTLFVQYPRAPVGYGQTWEDELTAPMVLPGIGATRMTLKRKFAINGDVIVGKPIQISATIEVGNPEPIAGYTVEFTKAHCSYHAIVDPSGEGTVVREIHSSTVLDARCEPSKSNASPGAEPHEIQLLSSWDASCQPVPASPTRAPAPLPDESPPAGNAATAASAPPRKPTGQSADYTSRGLGKARNGDWDGAIADLNQAIALDPGNYVACYLRGSAKQSKNDLDGAMADFTRAIAINLNYDVAYLGCGVIRQRGGNLEGAIADYTLAILCNPKSTDAYFNRGVTRQAKGDRDGAIEDFTQAILLDPKDPDSYFHRAYSEGDRGDIEGAMADSTQAITLDPNYAAAYLVRSLAKKSQGDVEGSGADYHRAVTLDPGLARGYGAPP